LRRTDVTAAGLAATVIEPDGAANGGVLYCLPGGGTSRHYFDLDAPGWSMAEHLAERGFVVVPIDHPAVGDSPAPDDPWTLTPAVVADADSSAVRELHNRLGGIPIGVGHSMGGMLTVTVQARHSLYAGLGLLGYAHSDHYEQTALAAHLNDEERALIGKPDAIALRLVDLAHARFRQPLPQSTSPASDFVMGGMQVPSQGLEALGRARSNLLACCGLASMLKCTIADVKQIDVPVFVGFGEHDITGNARATADSLLRCPDITLFELAGSGHNHNVALNRALLWDRLATWAEGVVGGREDVNRRHPSPDGVGSAHDLPAFTAARLAGVSDGPADPTT
jgi:pimeloyl-ACP methyl ester carboxylesterase